MTDVTVSTREKRLKAWSEPLVRIVVLGCLAVAFFSQTTQQRRLVQEGTQPYLIGDWTISYAGGVVRRGFSGWLLLTFAPEAPQALMALLVTQTLLYAVIFGVVAWWALRLPDPAAWAPFLLSPAFLLFGLNDFEGTHRKEIIVFAGLFVLAEAVRSGRAVVASTTFAIILFALGVLSHEANVFLVVPLALLVRRAMADGLVSGGAGRRAVVALGTAASFGLLLAVLAPGTMEQQRAICEDLLRRGFNESLCGGSLSYIGEPASGQVTRILLDALPMYALYALPAMFAIIPFLRSSWARDNRRLLLAAALPVAPLFLIAVDWGRWIMWAVVVATALTVVGSTRDGQIPSRMPLPVIVLFVVSWSMPHVGIGPASFGRGVLPESILVGLRALGARLVS